MSDTLRARLDDTICQRAADAYVHAAANAISADETVSQAYARAAEAMRAVLLAALAEPTGAPTPPEEADSDVIQSAIGHWFTQGGEDQFGPIEATNADELISAILRVVRAPVGSQAPETPPPTTRPSPTNCRYEPPFPGLEAETVLHSHGDNTLVAHMRHAECQTEGPHLAIDCGRYKPAQPLAAPASDERPQAETVEESVWALKWRLLPIWMGHDEIAVKHPGAARLWIERSAAESHGQRDAEPWEPVHLTRTVAVTRQPESGT